MHYIRFIAAFLVYTIIDVGWNLSPIALNMYDNLHESSGSQAIRDAYGKAPDTWGGGEILALLAFLLLIAFANSYLAIEPAIKQNSLLVAVRNSFVLGCAAYATYIVPIFIGFVSWPAILVPIDILIGGLLSLITSTVVTYVALRRRRDLESDQVDAEPMDA